MPLVRIDLIQGKIKEFHQRVGEFIYEMMVDAINVPPNDNFQIITEHDRDSLVYDPTDLNIKRTEGIVIIQIALNESKTVELEKEFYKRLAERLQENNPFRL